MSKKKRKKKKNCSLFAARGAEGLNLISFPTISTCSVIRHLGRKIQFKTHRHCSIIPNLMTAKISAG